MTEGQNYAIQTYNCGLWCHHCGTPSHMTHDSNVKNPPHYSAMPPFNNIFCQNGKQPTKIFTIASYIPMKSGTLKSDYINN